MRAKTCRVCGAKLDKDQVGLNRKLLSREVKEFLCLICLADYLVCTEDDLRVKIEEFKEQGCTLFD